MNYLIVDIGNTNIVMAVFDGKKIKKKWRISSFLNRTKDEYILWLKYIADQNFSFNDIMGNFIKKCDITFHSRFEFFFKKSHFHLYRLFYFINSHHLLNKYPKINIPTSF